jgi:SNF2 family DNA or RNA helicase
MRSESFKPEIYQEAGTAHLLGNKHAALFAGCGLGKTAMVLAALQELFEDAAINGAMVIAPLRVANLTWLHEAMKWKEFSWMRVANLRTDEGKAAFRAGTAHIYTVNYEALPKLSQTLFWKKRNQLPFSVLIWDELSKAKNPDSVRVNAMRAYWERIDYHWGLTGTPTPNSKLDLFAQYRALDNGKRLGSNFYQFRKRYFFAVDREERKWGIRRTDAMRIEELVTDMTLVLKSSDYLDIPDVTEEDIEITLPKCARERYKELERELFLMIDSQEIEALNAAVLIGKLLQVTSGAVYDVEKEVVMIHDAKIQEIKRIFNSMDSPLMIACQYKHEEVRVAEAIPSAEIFSSARGHAAQDSIVRRWNEGEIPALIVHPRSMSHGLNLQGGGSTVAWMSMGWSREDYDQLNARLARKGQKNPTRILRLLCKGTVDDAVAETLRDKGDEQARVMDAIENLRMLGRI